ncbi:phosphonate metabolism protein/1,5-bisphosphokinase (PRPP-forming) PhnN [Pseudomonas guariconensis]|uniref:phosphonate metabolism protein/1,5-bisphosphokinase (PRPP-forming) PhnN n=1 Tax=Pseudomonas guariconensis TaxID=1288410 RepID=UPI0025A9A703|nr:phosphonate metabolism protein/1,5-bisphosphokinase (PRPP-forming) PhnN [Pseudomonas guariconensis]MDM9593079.1 phosphonate metabolism protein/1,5-bisphosphokinase (PRPP-forming) PhnN [Pseudomonas guariconensis]MDM9605906.1 phosphonate metabolism protein/1,5-bisphosphokinase (PRPP-forming) PhnN [Pseudomonas guariconensis]MDM9610863.1 phosphonate metabolism protein/1,5-bisphosphokinase (PRPP-forming) PhnN [Pseudomonas guariconensis]
MRHDASGTSRLGGRLIFLIGPSGSGKDSLIDAARVHLLENGVEVARRVITRSAESRGEAALSVSPEVFEQMCEDGEFAMHWQANGLQYGIPVQVNEWLSSGRHVLVNGSRGYLPEARRRYPNLLAIRLEVAPQVLRERLLTRGREAVEQVEQRLARSALLQAGDDPDVHVLDNSTSLADTVKALLRLLVEEGVIAQPAV